MLLAGCSALILASTLAVVLLLSGSAGGSSSHVAPTRHPSAGPVTQQHPLVAGGSKRQHRAPRHQPRPAHPGNTHPGNTHPGNTVPRAGAPSRQAQHPHNSGHPQHSVAASATPAPAPNSTSTASANFKASYRPLIGQLTQTARAIGSALRQSPSRTGAQIITTFRGLFSRWRSQLGQLQTLKPPSTLASGFDALIGAGARVESDLNAIVTAIRTHNKVAGEQAVGRIVNDLVAAHSADAALAQKLATV